MPQHNENLPPWRPYSDIKTHAVPLLEKYGVDVYFAGHGHSYLRSAVTANKTTWVMVGGAGCDEMAQATEFEWLADGMAAPNGSTAFSTARYASGVLHANLTHLSWELVDSVTGEVIDGFQLAKV